jgi:hypothetical protein
MSKGINIISSLDQVTEKKFPFEFFCVWLLLACPWLVVGSVVVV